jgi:teichuronic acid biosynthesis glycosyltransferase TuaC
MNLLVIVSNYPHPGHVYSGVFNERSARALKQLGHEVEVLAPRPYLPTSLTAWSPRWRAYGKISEREDRADIAVYRPAYPQLPFVRGAYWTNVGAYLVCVRTIQQQQRRKSYDMILSFNLVGAGGLAWRLARRLGIPAAGWATGNDVRVRRNSSYGRVVRTALQRLDIVFYQSAELRERAAELCEVALEQLPAARHVVLPRGIEQPPELSESDRMRVRSELGVRPDQIVVVYIGRVVEPKGIFDLMDAFSIVRNKYPGMVCLLIGAKPGFDDVEKLNAKLAQTPSLAQSVRIIRECPPDQVWEYLKAADIFAFPSHSEGMPNSLLEAMAAGVPAVAFAIPPVLEIANGAGVLKAVRPRSVTAFARALAEFAESLNERNTFGERGRRRVLDQFMARDKMAEAVQRLGSMVEGQNCFYSGRIHGIGASH